MAYASPIMSAPLPSDPLPSPVTPGDGSMKHTRDDSGLGAEQDNGSLNSSSRSVQSLRLILHLYLDIIKGA